MNINQTSFLVNSFVNERMFKVIHRNNRTLQEGRRRYLCYLTNRLFNFKTKQFYFSQQEISSLIGCSRETLRRSDHCLIQEGIITKIVQKPEWYKGNFCRQNSIYTINRKILWEKYISKLKDVPWDMIVFFVPNFFKKRNCGINTFKTSLKGNTNILLEGKILKKMFEFDTDLFRERLIKMAREDGLDDGKLADHADNMFSYYSDPRSSALAAKLESEGKYFQASLTGLYTLFKRWIKRSQDFEVEKKRIKDEVMSCYIPPTKENCYLPYWKNKSSTYPKKPDNSEKIQSIPVFLFNNDLEEKIKEAVGEVHYVSWFCTKNEDGQWLFRHTLTGNSEDGLLLTISDPFTYSKVSEVFISSRLESLNIEIIKK